MRLTYPLHRRCSRASGLGAVIAACGALAVTACGGTSPPASTAPSATPMPASTPIPAAGARFTESGAVQLVTPVAATAIACSFPSLNGPEITVRVQNADQSLGGFLTISANQVFVRIGAGSGTSYTQRNFAGPGVTAFDAGTGATFNATLTDTSPPGQRTGTIGSITSIAGSVSCGTKTPGSGDISIAGTSTGGAISGTLTSIYVNCTNGPNFALINALAHVGSVAATVEVGGGGTEVYFASFGTSSASYFFSSSKPGLYTVTNGHVHWNDAVLTQTGVAGAAGHTVAVSGDATCGTP